MIRIDEIYNIVFLPIVQHQSEEGLHWFDPFGSTDFKDLCAFPKRQSGNRWVFWDQEPVYRYKAEQFFNQFIPTFNKDGRGDISFVTSEHDSDDVQWVCDTYGIESCYYFFHGWAALDWYRGYNRTSLAQSFAERKPCLLYTSPSPRDRTRSRMPSSA